MSKTLRLVRRAALLAATAPFAALLAAPAQAQQTETVGLEEVLVTAQRIEENLQTTPVAVTAITSEFLDRFDLRNVTSLQNAAPNLVFNPGTGGSSSQVSAFIRGVGEFDFLLTTDPAVGLYVDGVYMARTFGANLELADVERVEVLRGPQGTLFGKNNIGGAINITTRKPTGSGESRAQMSFGNYSSIYLDGYTDQALSDTLSLGVSVLYRKGDGWQERPGRDGGQENKVGARATLSWKPSDTFDSTVSVEGITQDQTSNTNVMLVFTGGDFFSGLYNGFVNPGNPCCTTNSIFKSNTKSGLLNHDDLYGAALTWTNTWQLSDAVQFKSITAQRNAHAHFGLDPDNTPDPYNGDVHNEHHTQISQEFQASGRVADRLSWVAGVYYFRERTRDQTRLVTASGLFDALTALGPDHPSGLYFARYALDFNLDFDNRQTTTDYAGYLNGKFDVTDKLTLEAGLRYTKEKKEFKQFAIRRESGGSLFLPVDPFTGIADETNVTPPSSACSDIRDAGTKYDCEKTWNDVSPRLGVNYKFSDTMFGYASASRGFRSGGFDGRPTTIEAINDFKPEHLKSYELGLKTLLADNRVRLNTAVFYNTYDDKQVLLTFGTTVVTQNAAKAKIYGLETDLEAAVTSNFTLRGSLGYTHAKFDKWFDPSIPNPDSETGFGVDYSWRKLRNTPEWTANLGGVYDQPLADGAAIRYIGNVSFVDDMFLDSENSDVLHADSRTLVDAGLFYVAPDDEWEIGVQVKNLTDEHELVSGYDARGFFGYAVGYYNQPRRYFLTVKYKTK
jgi:iron complex outermembrane receptor protein